MRLVWCRYHHVTHCCDQRVCSVEVSHAIFSLILALLKTLFCIHFRLHLTCTPFMSQAPPSTTDTLRHEEIQEDPEWIEGDFKLISSDGWSLKVWSYQLFFAR